MKKIFTCVLPVLGLITSGITFVSAQNEKTSNAACDVAFDFPLVMKNPSIAGKTNWQPNPMALLYDNGPLVNQPGQGSGGADVSALHDNLGVLGFGHAVSTGYRVSDDFTIPAGQTWSIDSIIFYAYQTTTVTVTPPTSTITEVRLAVRNASPLVNAAPSTIVWGDTVTNMLNNTYWSGIYRTSSTALTAINRSIMKDVVGTSGLSLTTGTYWLDWTTGGTLGSGPWAPCITFPTQTITGDAKQFNGATFLWASLVDTALAGPTDDAAQGLPFTIHGTSNSGVNELYANNNVSVFPNPMSSSASVTISDNIRKSSSGFSFVVYDLIGNLVKKTENLATNKFTFHKDDMPSGMYIYEVHNGNQIIKRGKLSVQ